MQPTNPNQFTDKAWEAIVKSQDIVRAYQQQQLDVEHLIIALLEEPTKLAIRILFRAGVNVDRLRHQLEAFTQCQPKVGKSEQLYLSRSLDVLLDRAEEARARMKDSYISVEHILLAFADDERVGRKILKGFNAGTAKLEAAIKIVHSSQKLTDENLKSLQKYGRDLIEEAETGSLNPLIGRDEEIRYLLQALSLRSEKIPLLIGEPGVGKTAIVEALAQRIVRGDVPESIKYRRLVALDLGGLIIYAKDQAEFEYQLREVLREVIIHSQERIVLFIDDLHTIIGSGVMNASNLLKMMLTRGELLWISATTPDEYRKLRKKDATLWHRFYPIYVQEPTVEHTISILRSLKERYEVHHNIKITDSALVAAADLSLRHISDRFLPDKAIDLMDEASAMLKMEITSKPAELDTIDRRLMQLEMEKLLLAREDKGTVQTREHLQRIEEEINTLTVKQEKLNNQWQYEKQLLKIIADLKTTEDSLKEQIAQAERNYDWNKAAKLKYDELKKAQGYRELKEAELLKIQSQSSVLLHQQVTESDIAKIVAKWTVIPVYAKNNLSATETEQQPANQAEVLLMQEQQRTARLLERLSQMGIDPYAEGLI